MTSAAGRGMNTATVSFGPFFTCTPKDNFGCDWTEKEASFSSFGTEYTGVFTCRFQPSILDLSGLSASIVINDLPGIAAFKLVSHEPLPLKVPVMPIWYVEVKPTLTTPSTVRLAPGMAACTKSIFWPSFSTRFLLLNTVDNFPDALKSCGERDKVNATMFKPWTWPFMSARNHGKYGRKRT